MRTIIRNTSIIILLICTGNSYAQNQSKSIQQQIKATFIDAQENKDKNDLLRLNANLEKKYKKHRHNIFKYWQAYSEYYTAIYYISQGDKKNSEEHIDKAVSILEKVKNKTSEDYALLALSQGFAIQFKSMIKIISMSRKIEKNGKLAIEKDKSNLRAYYALASNDFYTPEQYGGGKYAEKYLLKAISLPEQKIKNNMLPSWGKEESYELLIRWYIRKNERAKAEKYFNEAIKKYPNYYPIKQLSSKIKNN